MSDDQVARLSKQVDQIGVQILKLYQHMEERFDKLEAKIDTKADKQAVEHLYQLLDADLKHQETNEQERLLTNHQLQRHEDWLKQLAGSTKTKLVPEP